MLTSSAALHRITRENLRLLWAQRGPGTVVRNPEEAVILASIVEKETGNAGERDKVAGLFTTRLKKGMRLQSDPTIIYGITKGVGKLDRPIRRSEIEARIAALQGALARRGLDGALILQKTDLFYFSGTVLALIFSILGVEAKLLHS